MKTPPSSDLSTQLKINGLVVKTIPYKESDIIINIFSESNGLVSGIAKGARKSKKRFFGSLEILDYGVFNFTKSNKGDLLFLDSFDRNNLTNLDLRSNLKCLKLGYFICELLEKFFKEDNSINIKEHNELFLLCLKLLNQISTLLNSKEENHDNIDKILALIGYFIYKLSNVVGLNLLSITSFKLKEQNRENTNLEFFHEWLRKMSEKNTPISLQPRSFLISSILNSVNTLEEEMNVDIKSKLELSSFN